MLLMLKRKFFFDVKKTLRTTRCVTPVTVVMSTVTHCTNLPFAAHRQGDQHGVRVPAAAGQGQDRGGGGPDPELGKIFYSVKIIL